MNTRALRIIITSLALSPFAIGGSNTNSQPVAPVTPSASPAAALAPVEPSTSPAAVSTTQSPVTALTAPMPATQQTLQAKAPAETEPTEAEMREAVQRHLDSLNSQMRPQPAPAPSTSSQPKYVYSPYWHYYGYGYYQKDSKDSQYENWQDVARRAHATARVEITSFKKIHCTPAPDEGGFSGEFIAELELRGAPNPSAQEIMQTSGKRLKGFFYRGDKGWIFGEAPSETK